MYRKNTSERKQQAKKILNKQKGKQLLLANFENEKENTLVKEKWVQIELYNVDAPCMLTKHIVTISALFCDFLCRRLSHCWYDAPTTSYASVGRIYTNMSFVFKYIHEEAEAYTRFCSQISHYPVLDASCDRVAHRLLESNQATYIHHDFFTLIKSRNFSKVSNFTFKKSF